MTYVVILSAVVLIKIPILLPLAFVSNILVAYLALPGLQLFLARLAPVILDSVFESVSESSCRLSPTVDASRELALTT